MPRRPLLRSVLGKTLWDQRRGIVIWSLGISAVGVLYAAFYPTINSPEMAAALEAYPKALLDAIGFTDVTTPAGYLGSTTYGLLCPILVIIFAGVFGARAIAGEEESGRLDLLLAHPVERWQVVLQRAGALLLALLAAGVVLFVVMIAAAGPAQFAEIGPNRLGAATAQLVLLGLLYGTLTLAVGAATGRRGLALGILALLGVAGYLANTLAPTLGAVAWTQHLSPFFYFNGGQPLVNGWQLDDGLVLLGVSVVLTGLAILGFRRRDVAV